MQGLKESNSTTLPPEDLDKMLDVAKFLNGMDGPAVIVGPEGQSVDLPEEAFRVLKSVVEAMRFGKAITVAPVDQKLTTQQAADFLGISRPTLVKKLDAQEIPYELPAGRRHRRIRLVDVLEYQERQRIERRKALDELTFSAEQDGLYDMDANVYKEALREARRTLPKD
ncbi:helix-turn-helix domain-containing protein [Corynebacterium lizhenjunii]|uniref:Helix-turn-helix domain-containing protein n=1 Tax=Corynebacterium lizhenjunii TaxID=2709394 RepID=A0A7T0KF72_9CORY|nr:helix-turn-helix domain-containing protein [Corynebacterium lizhenjunii]QPK78588.1 helix-turn-helix domain-containing protein [Corynebacterium lizhenjunii]